MKNYSFSIVKRYSNFTIAHHVSDDGTLWASHRNWIVRKEGEKICYLAKFPFAFPRDLAGWCRPLARAFRADKCNLYCNSAGNLLAIRAGRVYMLHDDTLITLFSIQGDCALHGGICEDEQGFTYFGEYFMNPERGPVRIWRVDPALENPEIAREFPAGRIRHVHGIFRDPYDRRALWVTVGDLEGECHLLRTRDRFETIESFGDGSQHWRAVTLFFAPDHVCWLTDSNLEQNYACRMQRKSGALEIGQKIDCSGWYGSTTREGITIAFTTVERGPGIHRRESSVLISEDAFHWQEVHAFIKDFWRPVQLFKYGVISTPTGKMSMRNVWISGEGLVDLDGSSIQAEISLSGEVK